MKELPDLHKQAFIFKNRKRLQHDGGRAWIKDSQLHESRRGVNGHLETISKGEHNISVETGKTGDDDAQINSDVNSDC